MRDKILWGILGTLGLAVILLIGGLIWAVATDGGGPVGNYFASRATREAIEGESGSETLATLPDSATLVTPVTPAPTVGEDGCPVGQRGAKKPSGELIYLPTPIPAEGQPVQAPAVKCVPIPGAQIGGQVEVAPITIVGPDDKTTTTTAEGDVANITLTATPIDQRSIEITASCSEGCDELAIQWIPKADFQLSGSFESLEDTIVGDLVENGYNAVQDQVAWAGAQSMIVSDGQVQVIEGLEPETTYVLQAESGSLLRSQRVEVTTLERAPRWPGILVIVVIVLLVALAVAGVIGGRRRSRAATYNPASSRARSPRRNNPF